MATLKSRITVGLLFTLFAVPIGVCIPFVFVLPAFESPGWVVATDFDRLPVDGTPIELTLFSKRPNAWQQAQGQPFRLFVSRAGDDGVAQALLAEHHPDLKIPVTFDDQSGVFRSTCWQLSFSRSGHCREDSDGCHDLFRVVVRVVDGQVQVRLPPTSTFPRRAV